jgi:2-polyprenyl-3-methyl-5-hydroxy-6-metoxy-1,4-benzoquinol methylase
MDAVNLFESVDKIVPTVSGGGLELASCPLCRGIRHSPVLRGRDPTGSETEFQVVRCDACGLHFTNPRPTAASIGAFYQPDYRPHSKSARADRPLRGWYPHEWLKAPSTGRGKPRLLDFGCGAGHFLAAMQRQGWDATGLDVSPAAVEMVRNSLGVNALAGSLPHEALEPGSFELITMWHALEHVHEPAQIVREALRLLAPGGRLVLAVPNFAGWQRRWFGRDWYGLELPRHIVHFCAATLRRTLEEASFHVRAMRCSRHADWGRASALRAWQGERVAFPFSLLRYRKMAALAAWALSRGQWGDALLALAEPAHAGRREPV